MKLKVIPYCFFPYWYYRQYEIAHGITADSTLDKKLLAQANRYVFAVRHYNGFAKILSYIPGTWAFSQRLILAKLLAKTYSEPTLIECLAAIKPSWKTYAFHCSWVIATGAILLLTFCAWSALASMGVLGTSLIVSKIVSLSHIFLNSIPINSLSIKTVAPLTALLSYLSIKLLSQLSFSTPYNAAWSDMFDRPITTKLRSLFSPYPLSYSITDRNRSDYQGKTLWHLDWSEKKFSSYRFWQYILDDCYKVNDNHRTVLFKLIFNPIRWLQIVFRSPLFLINKKAIHNNTTDYKYIALSIILRMMTLPLDFVAPITDLPAQLILYVGGFFHWLFTTLYDSIKNENVSKDSIDIGLAFVWLLSLGLASTFAPFMQITRYAPVTVFLTSITIAPSIFKTIDSNTAKGATFSCSVVVSLLALFPLSHNLLIPSLVFTIFLIVAPAILHWTQRIIDYLAPQKLKESMTDKLKKKPKLKPRPRPSSKLKPRLALISKPEPQQQQQSYAIAFTTMETRLKNTWRTITPKYFFSNKGSFKKNPPPFEPKKYYPNIYAQESLAFYLEEPHQQLLIQEGTQLLALNKHTLDHKETGITKLSN